MIADFWIKPPICNLSIIMHMCCFSHIIQNGIVQVFFSIMRLHGSCGFYIFLSTNQLFVDQWLPEILSNVMTTNAAVKNMYFHAQCLHAH